MNTMKPAEPSNGLCAFVFALLLALLGVTVGVSLIDLGRGNFFVAVVIATSKAVLILWFFMRAGYGAPLVRVVACAGFLWLSLLFAISMSDYFTRG